MERKVHPGAWTRQNIAAMKSQLQSMGLSLDWAREIATCDPSYYKHQQKMFLDFLKAGLVERKQSKVNWDPVDMTVLANEQVIDGKRLALGRAGRAARADAVVLQDQRLRRGAAGGARHARALAGKSPADAEELDRPLGGPAGPLRARSEDHAGGRETSWRFSRRAATRCSARASSRSRPTIRSRRRRRRRTRRSPTSSPRCKRMGTAQEAIETAEKQGFDTGIRADPSVRPGVAAAGLRRELHPDGLRHRRDLRLPGARPARPRLRQQVRPRQHAGGLPAGAGPEVVRHHRHRL